MTKRNASRTTRKQFVKNVTVHYIDKNGELQIAENVRQDDVWKYYKKFEVEFVDSSPHANVN